MANTYRITIQTSLDVGGLRAGASQSGNIFEKIARDAEKAGARVEKAFNKSAGRGGGGASGDRWMRDQLKTIENLNVAEERARVRSHREAERINRAKDASAAKSAREAQRLADQTARAQTRAAERAAREVQRIEAQTRRQAEQNARALERTEHQIANNRIRDAERVARAQANALMRNPAFGGGGPPGGRGGSGIMGAAFLGGALGTGVGVLGAVGIQKVTSAVTDGTRAWLDYASKIENSQIAFKTMLGSAEAAHDHLRALQQFALSTPFEFGNLVDASQRMQALGFAAKEVIPILTDVGNAVAAAGGGQERLDRVIKALADVRAKEKLQSQEIRQFAEAGISVYKILGEETGKTAAQIQKMTEEGKISSDLFLKAFQKYSQLHFGDLMAQQSRTFVGAITNIKDALLALGSEAFLPTFNMIRDKLNELQDSLQNDKQQWKDWGEFIARQIGYVADGVGTIVHAFQGLKMIFDEINNSNALNRVIAVLNAMPDVSGLRWLASYGNQQPAAGPRTYPTAPGFDPFGKPTSTLLPGIGPRATATENIYSRIAPKLAETRAFSTTPRPTADEDKLTSAQRSKAERAARDREIVSAMKEKIDELAADFMETFNKALPARFGQTALHSKLNYDHRAAADISLDPRTAEGKFVLEWLSEQGINARASLGPEVSKRTGKVISTDAHIHAGELSGSMGRGLKMREGLLSPRALKEQTEAYESPYYGMTSQEIVREMADKRAKQPLDEFSRYEPDAVKLPVELERQWTNYYEEIGRREQALKDRRADYAAEYMTTQRGIIVDIGQLEIDLEHLRAQNADEEFVRSRRMLSTRNEQYDLEQRITKVQDEMATGPYNQALRVQLALLEDIVAIRRRDEDAIISQNRAMLEMADSSVFHGDRARARIMEFFAAQRGQTETFADAFIRAAETTGDAIDRVIGKITQRFGIFGDVIKGILSDLARVAINRVFMRLLDVLLPTSGSSSGARASGGSGGGGLLGAAGSFIAPLLNRGGGGAGFLTGGFAGGPGGAQFALPGGGSSPLPGVLGLLTGGGMTNAPATPLSSQAGSQGSGIGGALAQQALSMKSIGAMFKGIGFKQKAGSGGALAAMMPLLGLSLGMGAGGSSGLGRILGGAGGALLGIGLTAAPAIFGAGGALASPMIAGLFSNPITAVVGGALLIGAYFLGRAKTRKADEKARDALKGDVFKQLDELQKQASRGQLGDPDTARAQAQTIVDNYYQQVAQLKTKSVRQSAENFRPFFKTKVEAIAGSAARAQLAADFSARWSPTYAFGGQIERTLGLMSGRFDARDDVLVRRSRGETILNPAQVARLGGQAAMTAAGVPGYSPSGAHAMGGNVNFPAAAPTEQVYVLAIGNQQIQEIGRRIPGAIIIDLSTKEVDAGRAGRFVGAVSKKQNSSGYR